MMLAAVRRWLVCVIRVSFPLRRYRVLSIEVVVAECSLVTVRPFKAYLPPLNIHAIFRLLPQWVQENINNHNAQAVCIIFTALLVLFS